MNKNNAEAPAGYTLTELGILPNEWEIVKMREASHLIMGQSPPGSSYNTIGNGMPFLQGKAEFGERSPKHIKYTTQPIKISPKDSVLISVRAPVGDVNLSNLTYCIGRGLASISLWEGENTFLFYLLRYLKPEIEKEGTGSTFKAINKSKLESFIIPLPPLTEQKTIAHVLQVIQEAKEKTEEVVRATKELKKSMMRHLFNYGPVSSEEAERVKLKETEIGMMPEEWEIAKLGELSQIRYGLGQPPAFDENGLPMIRATNIKKGRIVKEGLIYVRRDAIPPSRNPFLKNGEVIVVRSGAYTGDVAMVTSDWEGAVAGYDLVVSPSEQILPLFCSQYLLSEGIQKYFRSQRDRSAQPHINSHQLANTLVSLPPFPIQQQIAEILSAIDGKIEAEENKKSALEGLFKTLLHDLMTAKIRVNNLPSEA